MSVLQLVIGLNMSQVPEHWRPPTPNYGKIHVLSDTATDAILLEWSPGTVPFYFQADIYKVVLQFLYVYFGTWREGGGGVDVGEVLPTYLQFSRRKT
jgi:hypothetical protein